jgi:hypothetical protein
MQREEAIGGQMLVAAAASIYCQSPQVFLVLLRLSVFSSVA